MMRQQMLAFVLVIAAAALSWQCLAAELEIAPARTSDKPSDVEKNASRAAEELGEKKESSFAEMIVELENASARTSDKLSDVEKNASRAAEELGEKTEKESSSAEMLPAPIEYHYKIESHDMILRAEVVGIELFPILTCRRDKFMWAALCLALAFFVFEGLLRCAALHAFLPRVFLRHAVMRAMQFLFMHFAVYSVHEMAVLYYRASRGQIYINGFANWAACSVYVAMYKWRRAKCAFYGTGAEPGRYTEVFDVANIYMDLANTPVGHCFLVFLTQVCFFGMVFYSILKDAPEKPNLLFWSIAIFVVSSGTMFCRGRGNQIGMPFWVLALGPDTHFQIQDEPEEPGRPRPCAQEWIRERSALNFLAHGILRPFFVVAAPLVLMYSKDDMDFVQNCCALGWIATFSDLVDAPLGKSIRFHWVREHAANDYVPLRDP